jgi:nucleotide-binding universal stress UspA family protein
MRPKRDSPRNRRAFLPLRRILCPVDFSDFSRAAVDRAVALATPFRAEITALFVLPFVSPEDASTCAGPIAPEAGVQSAVAEDLEELLRPAREAGLQLRLCVRSGDCVGHILDEARDRGTDLIVMGTHGRSGLERWMLGSVTDSVLRKAPCPVLAVPRRAAPPSTRGRIVCAVSLSMQAARTVSYALSLGRSTGSIVTLVHVWDGMSAPWIAARCEEELRRKLHAVAIADGPPPCAVEEVVVSGSIHREILRLAEAQQAGLIVLGSDDQEPGSTARQVLRDAVAPVLVVRS